MDHELIATKRTYAGLFALSLATLMFEVLLTRIFSVTLWYHFAFMTVSIALFGMTAGALFVFANPKWFAPGKVKRCMALVSLFFSGSIIIAFLIHIATPFYGNGTNLDPWLLVFTAIIMGIPFSLSGIGVCLALTKFPERSIGKLYAADLIGGAIGCIALFYAFSFASGQLAVFITAFFAAVASLFFSMDREPKHKPKAAGIVAILLLLFITVGVAYEAQHNVSVIRLPWVKGKTETGLVYEKWNSFSRISIAGDPNVSTTPFGWGLSDTYNATSSIPQLGLTIDGDAFTVLTNYGGDLNSVDYLKYDVTNMAHYLRGNANVLVIGAGGGRDILSALAFDQRSVIAVEVNPNTVNAVNNIFGDFTGHLDKNPKVTIVADEARSYIARQDRKFDIIEASLIDTWAATTAGAFTLSENALYTTQAWNIFLEHLSPGGIISFSRWYNTQSPAEIYRLVSLASAALKNNGTTDPRENMLLVRNGEIGTLLVSNQPFSADDLATLQTVSRKMGFVVSLDPTTSEDPLLADIASGVSTQVLNNLPVNLTPPTDDRPFFFQDIKLSRIFSNVDASENSLALAMLLFLLIAVLTLLGLAMFIPGMRSAYASSRKHALPFMLFFCAIGFGFMLIEVSQIERLSVYLGEPAYSLSVVLSTLLLASGLGSYFSNRIKEKSIQSAAPTMIAILILVLGVIGIITPGILSATQSLTNAYRVAISVALLAAAGFFLGTAFPLGMRLAIEKTKELAPWFWGVNGAASVAASVLALAIAIVFGISASYWTGVFMYVAAVPLLMKMAKRA